MKNIKIIFDLGGVILNIDYDLINQRIEKIVYKTQYPIIQKRTKTF